MEDQAENTNGAGQGRRKFSDEEIKAILKVGRRTGDVSGLAKKHGFGRSTYNYWTRKFPEPASAQKATKGKARAQSNKASAGADQLIERVEELALENEALANTNKKQSFLVGRLQSRVAHLERKLLNVLVGEE
jgi:transposase-like protein